MRQAGVKYVKLQLNRRKAFFFEKKNQKTFGPSAEGPAGGQIRPHSNAKCVSASRISCGKSSTPVTLPAAPISAGASAAFKYRHP